MVTVAIQAGGHSRRMGYDKAMASLAGKSLIQHVLARVVDLGDEVILTASDPESYRFLGLRTVPDAVPGAGTLAGLMTALQAARGDTVLVLACDMPFVSRPLLQHMLALSTRADVVIPRRANEFEPFHAVYSRACIPAIQAALDAGKRRVISFFPDVRVLTVEDPDLTRLDPTGLSFFNVNTADDLAHAERILASGQAGAPGP